LKSSTGSILRRWLNSPLRCTSSAAPATDGTIRWDVWEDVAEPGRVAESFAVESWIEHQRQHARVTHAAELDQKTVNAFHLASTASIVRYLLKPK